MPALTVAEIAELCSGEIQGAERRLISGANTLDDATAADVSFAENPKAFKAAAGSSAGCLMVPRSFDQTGQWSLIRVERPRDCFVKLLAALYPKKEVTSSVHPTAVIALSARIPTHCFIGAYVTIGEDSQIGSGCYIAAGCRIGNRVTIGESTTLHANVSVYDNVRIGARVILHSGCVVGADGFGFTLAGDHYEKFPQVGSVEIGDDVEIGANSCVDRAALGTTRIGSGTKLDNLVHVGHNCTIGKHVVVAAQTGFSGSVIVGDYAAIGGQAGIGEKAVIDSKAVVGGKSGILTGQRIEAGEPVWGIPARPLRQHLKGLAHVAKLPDTVRAVRALEKRVSDFETSRPRG
jgi:UDP-3-O-[3-hydroxymyristoyl] glucosamine N-acyltransferase